MGRGLRRRKSPSLGWPVLCIAFLLLQNALGLWDTDSWPSCHYFLGDLILARFPGTVPTFLCASFLPFQVLACHCDVIQSFVGLESNGPSPNRKWGFSLFI